MPLNTVKISKHHNERDWLCQNCSKLMGRFVGGRIRILVSRSHQYLVSAPATSVCRTCGSLNELFKVP